MIGFPILPHNKQPVELFQMLSYTSCMAVKNRHKNVSRLTGPLKAAADYGIDIAALIQNIKRTPAERIKRHTIALNTLLALRKAKKAMDHPRDIEALLQLEAIKKLKSQKHS
jgi:hypothetical protein